MYLDDLRQYDSNMKDIPKFYCEFVKIVDYLLDNDIGIVDKSDKFLYIERLELKEMLEKDRFVPVNIKIDFWRGAKFILTEKDEIRSTKRVTIDGKIVRKVVVDLDAYRSIKRVLLYEELELGEDAKRS